ncbi:hypothetical protein BUALT_Bualt07G0052200 [Buddleja alternifolia]|uniref:RING-type domain-containing protein n=1 Tax=Buddleja alternifolia TaxID=168488 RepID=A0AAV6XEW4_9LAMI|nr:hypothetical protein BUALT_Bualt07G0052200 [Buddleja alternifolia]
MASRQRVYAAPPSYFYVNHDHNYSLDMINGNRPVYQVQNSNQDSGLSYSSPVGSERYYHYNLNRTRDPSTANNYAHRTSYDEQVTKRIRQDDDGVHEFINFGPRVYSCSFSPFLTLGFVSTLKPISLSEEVISKLFKTRNCEKDVDNSEICIVCQDDLCQEDGMIAVLDCGHKYHPMCIKQRLREKNMLHFRIVVSPFLDANYSSLGNNLPEGSSSESDKTLFFVWFSFLILDDQVALLVVMLYALSVCTIPPPTERRGNLDVKFYSAIVPVRSEVA